MAVKRGAAIRMPLVRRNISARPPAADSPGRIGFAEDTIIYDRI
jgi:hypothetical protein